MFGRIFLTSVVFLVVGCKHGPASAAQKYAAAPTIENPLTGKAQTQIPGLTSEPDMVMFSAFDRKQICFEGGNHQSPGEATGTRYSLRFLNTDEVDLKNAPTLKTSVVRVLRSQSQLVPVTRTVQDTVRDGRGNTIGTVTRQVQEMETHYETQVQICFVGPEQALTPDARFMVLMRETSAAVASTTWGIPMRPRSSWVWRFPAAQNASTPVASK